MPDFPQRRQSARYLIQLPLLHRVGQSGSGKVGVGWSRNIGMGGACVELAEKLEEKIPLLVRLQTDQGPIDAQARVIWTEHTAPVGGGIRHGVAFIDIGPDQEQALQALLLSKGEVRQAGVRLPLEIAVTCRYKGPADPNRPAFRGQTGNLSRGGLSLRLPLRLTPDTVIEVTLHTSHGPLKAEGVVVWVDSGERPSPGELIPHGLRFTAIGWSTTLSLGLVLAEPL